MTLEHIKPRRLGGTGASGNLAVAHKFCNQARSDAGITEDLRSMCRNYVTSCIEVAGSIESGTQELIEGYTATADQARQVSEELAGGSEELGL